MRAGVLARLREATFARHAASLGGGRIVASLLSAVWLVIAARSLPVSEFGDLSILLAVGAILVTVGDLGLPFLLADSVARHGSVSWATVGSVIRRRLVAVAVGAAVTAAAYLAVASDGRLAVPLTFAVSMLATAAYSTVTAAMRGLGRFGIEAVNEVASRLAVLVAGWVWLAHGGGLLAAVVTYALADVVSLAAVAAVANRHLAPQDGIDPCELTTRRTVPVAGGRFLATLYYRVDLWLVGLLQGSTAAAGYGAPYRLLDGVLLLPRAMGAVAVTHAGERHRRGLSTQSPRKVALAAAAVVSLVAVPVMLFAGPVIRLTFGPRYGSSAPILAVLMAAAIPGAVANVLIPLVSVRQGRRFAVTVATAFAGNVLLNLALIPRYGALAAAWTTLACQLALAATLYRLLATPPRRAAPPAILEMSGPVR
jgi:O-antigen/teichoic acid export membrane protein